MSTVTNENTQNVVLRRARSDDERRLWRLAGLDTSAVPAAPLLVAEVDGELRAAYSLSDGRAIADPFQPSAHLVELLALRGACLKADRSAPDGAGGRPDRATSSRFLTA